MAILQGANSKSKGAYRRRSVGISWFKSGSSEHIKKIRELILILEEHGVRVKTISTDRPGYIVYEDEIQIVAEPFADTKID